MKPRGLLIIALLLLSILNNISFDFVEIIQVNATPPPDNEGGVSYGTDWNVTGTEYRGNQTIILDGNLTVEPGGNLTLNNVTLIMNCSFDGEYNIEVQSGGTMWILNSSNVTSNNIDFEYMFRVRKDSNFTMMDSELHECGWGSSNPGLTIEANKTIIENSTFIRNYYGIYYLSSSNNSIKTSNFTLNGYGIYYLSSSNNSIKTSNFTKNYYCIYLHQSSYNNIENCNLSYYVYYGIKLYHAHYNNVTHCNLNASISTTNYGIQIFISNHNNIQFCNIINNTGYGIGLQNSLSNNITNCDISFSGSGINLIKSHLNVFENNTISNNFNGMGLQSSNNNTFNNTTVTLSDFEGINVYNSNGNLFDNCTITNQSTYSGFELSFSDNNTIKRCNFIKNTNGLMIGASSYNKILNCDIIYNDWSGIYLTPDWMGTKFSNNNTIKDCYFKNNNGPGVQLGWANNNNVSNCIFENNSVGVYLSSSVKNILSANKLNNNTYNFGISGNTLLEYVNNIDTTNLINGKPIYYWINKEDQQVPLNAGYIGLINSKNITIKNVSTFSNSQGILLLNTSNSQIENCTIQRNNEGIRIKYNSNNNMIFNCNISNNNWGGIELSGSPNNNISLCNITNNAQWGVVLDSSKNMIFNCNIIKNMRDGLRITSSNNNVINSRINSNKEHGINILSPNNNILNCDILNNSRNGIQIEGSNTLIDNCTILQNENGIELYHFDTQLFFNSNVTIVDCNISKNLKGLELFRYNLSKIENCLIIDNTQDGIWLRSSEENIICNNLIKNNEYGVYADPTSKDNLIYHNNFISNYYQAYSKNELNYFYKEYPICGNYWNDYDEQWLDKYPNLDERNGPGQFNDGKDCIGDYEYEIRHSIYDWYPFIYPNGWLPPQEPISLKGPSKALNTTGTYTLTWQEQPNIANYTIEEFTSEFLFTPIAVYTTEATFFQLVNRPDDTYYYRTRAQNLFGKSPWSNTVKIIVDRLPDKPSGLMVEQILTGNELKISWNKNIADTVNYTLWSNRTDEWQPLVDLSHPNTEYIDFNLTDGVRYYYKLQAWDAIGSSSGFSDVVSNISIDKIAPAIPLNFTATAISIDTINLSWSRCPDPDLMGYEIYRSFTYDGIYTKLNSQLINITTFQDPGRGSNTTYFYKIRAYDEVPNYSSFSVIISNTTLPILDLTHPHILSFTPNGTNVYPYTKLKVTFSELMNQASVQATFRVTPAIPGEYSWSIDKRTFIFDPGKKLIEGQTYNVSIGLNATDLAGNSIETPLTWEFTIGDYTAPLLISYSPNGTEVPITTTIEVVFNEELDKSYITSSAILLKHNNGTFVIGKITYSNKSIIFKPNNDLEYGINYTVMVNRLLRDLNGNILDQDFTWNFITESAEAEPSPEEETKGFDITMVGIVILIFVIIIFAAAYIMLKRVKAISKESIAKSKAPSKRSKKVAAGEADLQCQWCGAGALLEDVVCPECGEILDGEELEE